MAVVLSALFLLYAALISPVRLRCDVFWHGSADIDLWVRIWGLPLGRSLSVGKQNLLHVLPEHTQEQDDALRKHLASLGAVLRGDMARHYIRRHVHISRLDAKINLSLRDAARTAVAAGALQWAAQAVHSLAGGRARIAVVPEFYAADSAVEARCILFFRLGHMIPVCMAAWASWALEKREHGLMRTSKEV